MRSRLLNFYSYSAGALFLMLAFALLLASSNPSGDIIQPHDPVFRMPLRYLFWALSGLFLGTGLICLFLKPSLRKALPVALVMTIVALYMVLFFWRGGRSMAGYLGGFAYAFHIPPKTAEFMGEAVLVYLFIGSYACMLILWLVDATAAGDKLLKCFCPACGGHITFAPQNANQEIPCPHCQAAIRLREAKDLKMSCYFCKEHIEFPAHAIGKKLNCPHCKMEITLKEPTVPQAPPVNQ